MATPKKLDPPRDDDGDFVYCRYIRHWITGEIVYPKRSKYFRFRRRK